MDPDLKKKWRDAMETAKLTGGGGNGVDTANIMLGKSVWTVFLFFLSEYLYSQSLSVAEGRLLIFIEIVPQLTLTSPAQCPESHKEEVEHNQANTVTRY